MKIKRMAMNGGLAALAALTHISAAQAGNYYVAANGNDDNPGTLARPYATLPRAQQAARKEAGREAVTIFIREGTYYLLETLIFAAEDSGTKAAPVVYQAYEKEQAVISGGARLKDLKWENYKDGILQAKVPAGFATDQLFVNGERQPLARYPNFDPKERHFNGWAKDAFSPQRAARWPNPAGGFIHARQDAEWKATSIRANDGQPLGNYRWLVWAVFPIHDSENTVYQELQVISAAAEANR